MSFELRRKETVPEGIRRVACERIEKALDVLNGQHRGRVAPVGDKAVHEARKQFKQLRGALRLVSDELGEKDFARENRTFRDAGRPLSEVRDAKVMLDTLDALKKHYKGKLAAGSFKRVRAALKARRRDVRQRVLGKKHSITPVLSQVRKSSRRVPHWPLEHNGWKAVAGGLGKSYRKGRRAMEAATNGDAPDDDALHEWRKRTKDLRYQIELLARAWPETMGPLAESFHHLTDLLGQDHDLVVLQEIVEKELNDARADDECELLKPLIAQRRSELQKEARELGRKLYAESEGEFLDRVHRYWKAWR